MRRPASESLARTSSSTTWARSALPPRSRCNTGPCPIQASARRSSGWKTTITATTQNDQK